MPITPGGNGRDQGCQLRARQLGLAQLHRPAGGCAVHCKKILGQIDAGRNNRHGPSLSALELMRFRTAQLGAVFQRLAWQLTRGGEGPSMH